MPPLLLDDEEAVAVALGLRSAATGAIQGAEEAAARALVKMEQLLPQRLARRVAALQAMIVTTAGSGSGVSARTLSAIAAACRDQHSLHFRYSDYTGAPSARAVEPHRLVHTGRRWYLVAWDAGRKDWRTFRVDRIQPRLQMGARFVPREPPARDLAAYVLRGVWNAPPCRARVKLLAPAEVIAERLPPGLGLLELIDANSCLFEVAAPTFESLAKHLSWLDVDFEVDSPPELVHEVRRLAARYRRATGE